MRVLIVETDTAMRRLLQRIVLATKCEVILLREGMSTSEALMCHQPDLVILDNPEEGATIHQQQPTAMIMIVSTCTDKKQIVDALDSGADEYVVKPFGSEEIAARIRALLRRRLGQSSPMPAPTRLQSEDGYLVLDVTQHQVQAGERLVRLTATECELLRQLMMHEGRVMTHRALLQSVWGPEYGEEADYLRVFIRQLRRKVEPDQAHPCYLLTEPRIGYVFQSPPRRRDG
jgi:two-component system, OmpR family, KDP operon response regulator KdpE